MGGVSMRAAGGWPNQRSGGSIGAAAASGLAGRGGPGRTLLVGLAGEWSGAGGPGRVSVCRVSACGVGLSGDAMRPCHAESPSRARPARASVGVGDEPEQVCRFGPLSHCRAIGQVLASPRSSRRLPTAWRRAEPGPASPRVAGCYPTATALPPGGARSPLSSSRPSRSRSSPPGRRPGPVWLGAAPGHGPAHRGPALAHGSHARRRPALAWRPAAAGSLARRQRSR